MSRFGRIFAALLVLIALVSTAFGRANVICVESSGRISFGCDDLVPDELRAGLSTPFELGLSSQDCGFCHDYVVGQAIAPSVQHFALAVPLVGQREMVFSHFIRTLRNESQPVPVLDSSGSISPLKC
jgi:hypothetical protein